MFPLWPNRSDAGTRLFCLPHAGAGASTFRLWGGLLAPEVEVLPVQLPGRENRLAEPPATTMAELVATLVEPIRERSGPRFALFGHSMGALICYELAGMLTDLGCPPAALVVSGHAPPHLPRNLAYPATGELRDADLLEFLTVCGGTPEDILANKDMVDLIMPTLRADLLLCRDYRPDPRVLPVPITGLVGTDDAVVSHEQFARWAELTSRGCEIEALPGGHHGVYEQPELVTATLRRVLTETRQGATWLA